MKKHVCQMSIEEVAICISKVNRVAKDSWLVCRHAVERMRNKGVTPHEIYQALTKFEIIEYKVYPDERIVIRSKEIVLVLSIRKKTIITVWRNAVTDTHKTLDLEAYNEKLVVR